VKLLVWTNIPTHHQSAFLRALRQDGIDVVVHYFSRVSQKRIRLGWQGDPELAAGERYVDATVDSIEACTDWRERVHIVPGYSSLFLLKLSLRLSMQRVDWLHWSEPSRPWLKWYLTFPVKRAYAAMVNRYALGALAIGEMASQDFVRWGVKHELIRFVPYSIAPLEFDIARPAATKDTCQPIRFLFAGSLCHRKGIDLLVEAFHRVLKRFSNARLTLVGSDDRNGEYHDLVRALGIAGKVDIVGPVVADEIAETIAACDVLVLPSRFDGWGMVLNEAASLGKALIATDACGAAHHIIHPGVNGLRVPSGNVDALADAMLYYCNEPSRVLAHGRESLRLFRDFSPAANVVRFRDCLESLWNYRRTLTIEALP
jgi:glycosyltransferase involved in cell wall biosynthesis